VVAPAISNVVARQPALASLAVPWRTGSQRLITWSSQGDVPSVDIWLTNVEGRLVEIIAHCEPNNGSVTVTVPTGLTFGRYRAHVRSWANDSVFSSSAAFLIDDEHRERCVKYATLLLGLPQRSKLPYSLKRKIAVETATD
jgi:hypothetical protein